MTRYVTLRYKSKHVINKYYLHYNIIYYPAKQFTKHFKHLSRTYYNILSP